MFTTSWKLGSETLPGEDRFVVKTVTLETLYQAFGGYAVRFGEAAGANRTVRVEDTPYVLDPRQRNTFGAAGVTYPASTVSSVRIDVLFNDELAAAHCADWWQCSTPRGEMLRALGRGVGATAAHELGHQLGFAVDSPCEDCYDSRSAIGYTHFFSDKHWSGNAVERMRRVLPRG